MITLEGCVSGSVTRRNNLAAISDTLYAIKHIGCMEGESNAECEIGDTASTFSLPTEWQNVSNATPTCYTLCVLLRPCRETRCAPASPRACLLIRAPPQIKSKKKSHPSIGLVYHQTTTPNVAIRVRTHKTHNAVRYFTHST